MEDRKMITVREYYTFKCLSYCNFSENECKKTLKEIFEATKNTHIITGTFDVLLPQNRKLF